MSKKTYTAGTVLRTPLPRSKRLRELGMGGTLSNSSTVVSVTGGSSSSGSTSDGHTHANKADIDKVITDNDRYIYLKQLEETEDGYEYIEKKAKVGYADEAEHSAKADDAIHADKAYDVDADSPVYDKFLRKDVADIAAKITTFLEGLYIGNSGHSISISDSNVVTAIFDELKNIFGIVSSDFVSGDLGTGFSLKYNQETGRSYLEVDEILVRKLAYFVELIIKRLSYVGGEIILTPASMKCVKVEEYDACYRCYFEQDSGDKSIIQEFRIDDQVRAQTFNIKEGTSHNVTNSYYWRLVVAIGDNYIDLSKSDCDTGSGVPEAGDSIVQLGNRTDTTRQNAIILSTVGDDAPSIKQYKDIDSYSLEGKEVTIISPFLNKFIGQFISEATGKSYDSMFNELQADLGLIKEQTDKEYTIWFFEYVPTLANIPAIDWNTSELKMMHEQDMFYNTASGLAYRFVKSADTWEWIDITDQQTIKALENAAKAQDTADGKRRVFVSQPTEAQAYDVGDLWTNATYPAVAPYTYENDTLVCKTAKTVGAAFSIDHWKPASNGTTAYMKNLGDSILLQVSGNYDELNGLITQNQTSTDAAIREAETKIASAVSAAADAMTQANKGVSDAADAMTQANKGVEDASSAMAKALEAFNNAGTAQDTADGANESATANAAAIQVTDKKITALAAKVTFDDDGLITNVNKSGLVTTAEMNSLITEKFTFDADGKVTNISTAGLVTEDDFVGLFASQVTADGLVKQADISAFITADEAGNLISNATISADKIDFLGKTTINGNFVVDEEGNVTMKNATVTGIIYAERGAIGGFEIGSGRIGIDKDGSDNGMFLYNSMIGFNGDNMQTLIGCHNDLGTYILGRFVNTRSDYLPNYGLIFSVKNSLLNHNYAFVGTGDGILKGVVEGFRLNWIEFSQAKEVRYINFSRGKYVEVNGTYDDCVVMLPRLAELRSSLDLSTTSTDDIAVRLTVVKRSGSNVRLYGRTDDFTVNGSSVDNDQHPYLRDNKFGNTVYWNMGDGAVVEVLLTYSAHEYNAYTVSIHR